MIDDIATHDAEAIRRLVRNGEPLSTSAAQYGYTLSEARVLLDYVGPFLAGWWMVTT
jgi:hypothetical protein